MRAALTAGSTFAVTVLLGFGGGLLLAHSTGQSLWVIGGLFAGVFIGAIIAGRALLDSAK